MPVPAESTPILAGLSPLKLALLAQQVRARSEAVLRADPIAIVGMGCRLPGGVDGPQAFWRLLRDGVDAVSEVPPERWDVDAVYDPDPAAPGKAATRSGGFLGSIDGFDAAFFGILPREAERMDPQQRLFLEVATEALDHAGLARERLAGSRTGVFVASYYNDYAHLAYTDPESIDARTLTGTVHSVLANRLSYLLDLRGPSVSVDTACSSSLVAIHLACQSLRCGESDLALAGGVSLMIGEGVMISLSKVGFMAPDGRCKTFDASADGFGRGEGCSVIVLKRLADAVADGDRVLALVRGSAVNQDGHSTVLAAPNGLAQQELIREALANAQIDATRIGYVEAHGTGTALGDPIEVEALAATVGMPAPGIGPCLLGTAKANIAHLEAAAGATGVIKSVLVLRNDAVPPQVHFKSLNPHITLAGSRLQIPTQLTPWPAGAVPRCIGTSGFGVGGTNAHVVLEEAPRLAGEPSAPPSAPPWLLPLSAQSPAALRALAQRWIEFLPSAASVLPVLCAAAGERRSHYDHRLAVVASTSEEMCQRLAGFVAGGSTAGWSSGRRRVSGPIRLVFVFGGQGQQWAGMGRELLASEAVFRGTLHEIDASLRRHVPWSLLDELAAPEERSRLAQTEVAQPVIFAVQVALAAQWASWGVRPDAVVGHSIGEFAALHVAGVLSCDEALRVVVQRARVMQRATGHGAMVATALTESQALDLLQGFGEHLSIAAVNSPRGVVLSGQAQALAQALQLLDARDIRHRTLPVDYAFHSRQMAPLAAELVDLIGSVTSAPAKLPVYSSVTGGLVDAAQIDAAYVGRNVREPVRFADAVARQLDDGFSAFLEVGAHPVLGSAIAECAEGRDEPVIQLASLRRGRPERESMLLACAGLYANVRVPDWQGLSGAPAEVVDLPAYPWQHERYWLRKHTARTAGVPWPAPDPALPELLGRRVQTPDATVFEGRWPSPGLHWLSDHRVGARLLMPGMAMLEAIRAAAALALSSERIEVTDFVVHRPLVLGEDGDMPTLWQLVAHEAGAQLMVALHRASGVDGDVRWHKVASAQAARASGAPYSPVAEVAAPAPAPALPRGDVDAVYAAFGALGVEFGPAFRSLESLQSRPGGVCAWLHLPPSAGAGDVHTDAVHPAVLDGALQACVAAAGGGIPRQMLLPIGVERFRVLRPVPARLHARASFQRAQAEGSLEARIELRDECGELVALIEGARFVATRADATAAAGRSDPWLHDVVWQPHAGPAQARALRGAWLLLCDAGGTGDALAQALAAQGQPCLSVRAVLGTEGQGATVDPDDPMALDALLADPGWRDGQALAAVVHLWSLDMATRGGDAPLPSSDDDRLGAVSGLHLVQALARRTGPPPQLVFVTAGAQAAGSAVPRPAAAGLWGLASVVAVEHPELEVRLVDLDVDAPSVDAAALAAELFEGRTAPRRVTWRGAQRLVPRLQRRAALPADAATVQLGLGSTGTLDDLAWQATTLAPPGPGDVRVRILAAGINFRDVLLALHMVQGDATRPGAECAGVVEAVGADVVGFRVGDEVFGFAPGSLASHVTVPAAFMAPWPAQLGSLEMAAALPAAYLTAMLGLQHLAGLRAGQRVLIHAATGGVGMAAVQLARRIGAEVFATAGSPAKRELLRSLGVAHVFDSRTPDFTAPILRVTGGEGVDVVLNCLAGDFIGASVDALARDGCFLELGKRDVWSAAQFGRVRPDARYHVYDLGSAALADRTLLRPMLDELLAALAAGALTPLPLRVFEFAQVGAAFRLMAQARHTGKLVLRAPRSAPLPAEPAGAAALVRADATYWITGGLGALGLHTARWLVEAGARHLVLSGRHAAGDAARAAIRACSDRGAAVHVRLADAGDAAQMGALFDEIVATLPPLRGVVHAAGALDDGVLVHQDRERFARVMQGKAHGAFILDALTRDTPLDFFVLYSAVGVLLGPAGQGPYAAASAELDALAHARRAAGRPALSVAWSLWRDAGMAATMAAQGHDSWSARGLGWIDPATGFARLERLLHEGATHAAVLPIDWPRFLSRLPQGVDADFFAGLSASTSTPARPAASPGATRATQWRALAQSQRRDAVLAHLREQALQVLGLGTSTMLEARMPLKEAGLDSLMAVELRNALTRSIGQSLPATLLFDHPSLDALATYLMRHLELMPLAAPVPDAAAAALAGLSDAEAEAQLLAELDGAAPRSQS